MGVHTMAVAPAHSLKRSYADMAAPSHIPPRAQLSPLSSINGPPSSVTHPPMAGYQQEYVPNMPYETPTYHQNAEWMAVPRKESVVVHRQTRLPEKSLVRMSLQLKLRGIIMFAASPESSEIAIEQNFNDITHELLELYYSGVSNDEGKILAFLELVEERLTECLKKKYNDKNYRYKGPRSFERLAICKNRFVPRSQRINQLKQRWHINTSSRDQNFSESLSTGSKDGCSFNGAIHCLRDFDRFSLHFFNKLQHNRIDEALIRQVNGDGESYGELPKRQRTHKAKKSVRFAEELDVVGQADDLDRTPIRPTKPSILESLMVRTSRIFPVDSI